MRILLTLIVIVIHVMSAGNSVAQQVNPLGPWCMDVSFVDGNGQTRTETFAFGKIYWDPHTPNWNGKNTKNGNEKIVNVDTRGIFFPLSKSTPTGTITVTEAMVNKYWDLRFAGATRIGNPSWAMNCHGYSTGLGYWVEGGPTGYQKGFGTVKQNDWIGCLIMAQVVAGCIHELGGNNDHSIRIDKVSDYNTETWHFRIVTETTEKMAYAGTYRRRYVLFDDAPGPGVARTWYPRKP